MQKEGFYLKVWQKYIYIFNFILSSTYAGEIISGKFYRIGRDGPRKTLHCSLDVDVDVGAFDDGWCQSMVMWAPERETIEFWT